MPESSNSPTVLIVDDDPDMCELIQLGLLTEGIDADIAGSASMAVEKVRGGSYQAVVADLHLSAKNQGEELYRSLHASQPDLTVVLLSGDRRLEDIASELGAPHLLKPVRPAELAERLRELGVRSSRDS